MKPLCIELFAGTFGWGAGFIAEGFDVIGFDIMDVEKELGIKRTPGCQLVLQDVLTLDGGQFRNADCIVASPPCQAYSYRAMPWKRAKTLPPPDNTLFEACFRIQREASEAAGRYIPIVVENVRGAQRWVGRADWHFGSFYLWGDVPALMPVTLGRKNNGGSWFAVAHNTTSGHSQNPVVRATKGFTRRFEDTPMAWLSSKSSARKAASAQIAKIPFPLANWIARVYKP